VGNIPISRGVVTGTAVGTLVAGIILGATTGHFGAYLVGAILVTGLALLTAWVSARVTGGDHERH
jgi:hypothetical protein